MASPGAGATERWTTSDFEALSWHDCHVYGFRLGEEREEHGTADLHFDLDFILEWLPCDGRDFRFRVAPATLTFHEVFGLRIQLDYAGPSAGMTPFSLHGIEREPVSRAAGHSSFRWRLSINWPVGEITFESPGFTQSLTGTPRLVDRQRLLPGERR